MTQQVVNVGSLPGDGTGDRGQVPFNKVNANFTELYGRAPPALPVGIASGGTGQITAPLALAALGGTTLAAAETAINPAPVATAAETAAGVIPSNYAWPPGDIRRYGAALDGVTNDTAAVQRWLSVGGALIFPVAQSALISAACPMVSNTTITAAKGATILSATPNISLLTATGKNDIAITGLKFACTGTPTAFPVVFAHAYFVNCTNPIVQNCEFTGMNCGAITFDACTNPIAQNNNIYSGVYPTAQQQTSDIALFGYTGACAGGIVTENRCYGGGNFGICLQDAYSFFNSANNVISGNRIGGCQLYGVLNYMPSYWSINTFNQIVNNYIENIQGVTNIIGGAGGAGIYCVGAAAGGTLIEGNTIVNCCINTTGRGLAPAGIGVSGSTGQIFFTASVGGAISGTIAASAPFPNGNWNGPTSSTLVMNFSNGNQRLVTLTNGSNAILWSGALTAGSVLSATLAPYYNDPISVVGNKISGMTQYDGILVVSSLGAGVIVSSNTVNHPQGNTTGYPIHLQNSSMVTVADNVIQQQSTYPCILVESQINNTSVIIKGNNCVGGANTASSGCLEVTGDGTHTLSGLVVSGNVFSPAVGGAGTAGMWFSGLSAASATISDNYCNVVTMPALLINGCTGMRLTNNFFASTGATTVSLSGLCTGSFFDKSNLVQGGVVANTSTTFHVDQFGPAAPATGTWAVGDTIYNDFTATTVNGQFFCTVAGSPGTFVGHV